MIEHGGFLGAILEEPAEDVHRLVYADWLNEQGEVDFAEFIRLQCNFGSTRRSRKLLELYGADWFPCPAGQTFLPAYWGRIGWQFDGSSTGCRLTVRRGFIAEIGCSLAEWMAHGPALVRRTPLERVTLSDRAPEITNLPQETNWTWFESNAAFKSSHYLLSWLFHCLPVRYFRTRQAGMNILSTACLAWARAQPGTP
jgi:uncharacterized protein (TIGR02996 family)